MEKQRADTDLDPLSDDKPSENGPPFLEALRVLFCVSVLVAILASAGCLFISSSFETRPQQNRARTEVKKPSVPTNVETQQLSANVRDNAVGITDSSTCSDFFTTLCAWEQRETADSLRDSMMPRMKLLSKQMNEMGAVLHVHTNLCSLDFGLPRIVTQCTDCAAKVANHSFNMTNFEATVHRWGHNAQKSDIFRVIIALETQRTYIDTDILFLTLNKELYMSQFVAVAVWEDRRLEPTNSAFCLARPDLTNILSQQRSKLATSHEFTYTALGPDLMSSVLLGNGRPASLLPQNPPDNADPLRMFEQMQYPMLHLTGAIRIRNRGYGYDELVEEIMKQVDLVKQGTTREWHAKT